jgi:N-acetylglucosamine PTS system EIICBA or EIICB component
VFAYLQRIGRSLMLPIAVLPAAGILLRFGQSDLLNIPWMADAGNAVFGNLPLLFAVGVAAGFTADVGTAAVAAAVGYWVFTAVLVDIGVLLYGKDEALNTGVLGGILMGILAATLYARYHSIRLPEWLAFFGGRRFVPIVTAFSALVLGGVFGVLWHFPQVWLTDFANGLTTAGAGGAAVHAFLNRLLIPVGLHHVINTVVWFQFGDLNNFFCATGNTVGASCVKGAQGGLFMTGFFPIMLFGLPAAALAMYTTARAENRKIIGGILFSAALTSIITGITEPIEFSFMFVAPVLYVLHALLTGISAFVTISLGIRDGFTFSAGLIDYLINFNIAKQPILLLAVGVVFGVIYYVSFAFIIRALDVPTPGREPEAVEEFGEVPEAVPAPA